MTGKIAIWMAALLLLAGCSSSDFPPAPPPPPQLPVAIISPDNAAINPAQSTAQNAFFDRLTALCGQAFAGRLVSGDAADAEMRGKSMVMHVVHCSADRILIPFHIESAPGEWDRSRTWVISRTDQGLRLKHDHRHRDGSSDRLTLYGGDAIANERGMPGSERRQQFPADASSIAMFKENGLAPSIANIWAIEVDRITDADAQSSPKFVYELRRPNRHFRVEFDLSKPIAAPPIAWGW